MGRSRSSLRVATFRVHRNERGQSLVIVLSLITILFLLGSALAVHASAALRATRASAGQGDDFYAADAATELGIWWQRNGKPGNPPAQTINGVTTSTTINVSGGGGGCPASPTPLFMTGSESGVLQASSTNLKGAWSLAPNARLSTGSEPVHTGNYSLRINPTPSLGAYAQRDSEPSGSRFGPTVVLRFSMLLETLPTDDRGVLQLSDGTSGTDAKLFYKVSTQKWALAWATITPTTWVEGPAVVAGTWYDFDIRVTVNTNPRVAEWYVDGVQYASISSAEVASTGICCVNFGGVSPGYSEYIVYVDDIVLTATASDYPLGNVKISKLVPNAMGTHNLPTNYQNDDSTTINATTWQRLDESPMTGTTDYIKQVSNSGGSYIEVAFDDTGETCVRSASLVASVRAATTSPDNAAVNTVAAGWHATMWSGDASETFLRYVQGVVPTNGAAWTQSVVNGIVARVGFSTDTNPNPRFDSLILEYGWRPASGPATVTIVGTGGDSIVTTDYTDVGAGVPTLDTWTVTK